MYDLGLKIESNGCDAEADWIKALEDGEITQMEGKGVRKCCGVVDGRGRDLS